MSNNKINHKVDPRSIRDEIANNPFIRTIDLQIKQILKASIDHIYVDKDGEQVDGPKSPSAKRVDALLAVREDEILSIIKRRKND